MPASSTGSTLAVDSKGNVYTGEVDNGKRVQKFKPTPASRTLGALAGSEPAIVHPNRRAIERDQAFPVPFGGRLVVAPAFREGEAVMDARLDFELARRA